MARAGRGANVEEEARTRMDVEDGWPDGAKRAGGRGQTRLGVGTHLFLRTWQGVHGYTGAHAELVLRLGQERGRTLWLRLPWLRPAPRRK